MLGVWRRSRPRTRVVAGLVVLAVAGTLTWWLWWRGGTAADAQEQAPATRTVAASLETLEKTVTTTGTLTPLVQETAAFEVSGTVTAVAVAAGDTVTAGQTLATVDTLQLEADLLQARATLATAQAQLDSAQTDDDGTDAAQAQVDAAAAQVEVAQAAADDAQAAMDGATLVAPVDGLVTAVGYEVGDTVGGSSSGASSGAAGSAAGTSTTTTTTSAGITLVGTDAWRVDATVAEADVAQVAVGDQVEMTSDDLAQTVFGTVAEIGLVSSSTSGTAAYPVTVQVTGSYDDLHDGIAVDVEIVYERRTEVLTVPAAAVTTADDGTTSVTQTDPDGAGTTVPVEVGETSGDLVEIVSGLAEGDEVVMTVFSGRSTQSGSTDEQQLPGGGQLPEGFEPPTDGSFPGGGFPGGTGGGNG
ncbi:efflux RND transporter periplasmic adaptor subunit [Cellulomonas sp. SLBN-39]|uniref:efflux RND transporter periplasmic adaptor subunit n=1 Tax=Cellulomonas sp. SLBN-39 TaxID=2768446 RepID=UPI0011546D8F|nr:biotin/lipoyl-binding protein [Cellulomonas sp. SLBN-39]